MAMHENETMRTNAWPWHQSVMFPILVLLTNAIATNGWVATKSINGAAILEQQQHRRCGRRDASLYASSNNAIPNDLAREVRSVAEILWGGPDHLDAVTTTSREEGETTTTHRDDDDDDDDDEDPRRRCHQDQGEMPLPPSVPVSRRHPYFLQRAREGDPRAQHSAGLLHWNGFGSEGGEIDPEASARWHAAAAVQGNVDALAVLGGCLRTGSGVDGSGCKDVALGLRCIEWAAAAGNPSGTNKKAAMMESNDDFRGALRLYRECYDDETRSVNALLLFNLGYCLVHGDGIDRDEVAGEQFWRDAVDMAPEEGSEEAAWFLYQQYAARDNGSMATKFLDVAADLGHQDAEAKRRDSKS